MARRTMVDQWRDAAALAIGICKIRRRRNAGASGRCRNRSDAGTGGTADRFAGAAPPGDRAGQLIGLSMVLIFLRSLVYQVLFYALLIFWLLVAIPTFLMPRWAILGIA